MQTALFSVVTALLLGIAPANADEAGYTKATDIAFGDLSRQRLDIYTPTVVTDETAVLIFLFGGGFSSGDKGQGRVIGQNYASAGMIVVTPDYRTNTRFPDFVEDVAKAVAYTSRALRTSTGAPRPIVISGWSAGAYIGAMVSYDGRYLGAEGLPPNTIAGFIGLAGPYWGGLCAGAPCPATFPSGTQADWPAADFVDPGDPPMLLIQGTRDAYVDLGNLETLAAAGQAAGLEVTALVIENGFHKQVMHRMEDEGNVVHEAVAAFIKRVAAQ